MDIPLSFQTKLESRRTAVKGLRDKIAVLARQLELLEAELMGWEAAEKSLHEALAESSAPRSPISTVSKTHVAHSNRSTLATMENVWFVPPTDDSANSGRRLSGPWKTLIRTMVENLPRAFDLDTLEYTCRASGHPTTRTTLRSQMSIYTKSGIVDRVSTGKYRATRIGAEAAGVSFPDNYSSAENSASNLEKSTGLDFAGDAERADCGVGDQQNRNEAGDAHTRE